LTGPWQTHSSTVQELCAEVISPAGAIPHGWYSY